MTSIIRSKVAEQLKKICPSLNFMGVDGTVLQLCSEDLCYHYYWMKENAVLDWDKKCATYFEAYFIGEWKAIMKMAGKPIYAMGVQEWEKQIDEYISLFVKVWWKKYQQRVKVVVSPPKGKDEFRKKMAEGQRIWMKQFNHKERQDILKRAIFTMMQNGEFCGSKIIATQTIQRYLSFSKRKYWSLQDKINFSNAICAELRRMASISGPLIFLYPSKEAMVREWRDKGGLMR